MKHMLRSRIASRCLGARASQDGAVAPLMVLALVGGLIAVGYAVDALRMTSDASQLKRATDAAALAIGREYLRSDKDFDATSQTLAQTYVRANLGLDSELRETLSDVRVIRGSTADNNATFEVTAQFTSKAAVSGNPAQTITIRSKVEAHVAFTEVALVLPSRFDVDPSSEAAMTRIAQGFAESVMRDDGHVYMSVVPYGRNVNVYDAKHPNRPRNWALPEALRPKELMNWNFFDETGIKDLASPDTPDALGKRFCPLRGLNLGENYFWDQAPEGQFYISYWVNYRFNVPLGYDFPWREWYITSRTTNAEQGCTEDFRKSLKDKGQDDCFRTDEELDLLRQSKTMISNTGCPDTPVLPLRNRLEDIASELDLLKKQHIFYKGLTAGNLNFGFALGWGAMTLAPAFRGSDGWGGDPQVPRDFDSGNGEHQKAIVMLMKTEMDSFFSDSDASTAVPGNISATTDHTPNDMPKRYKALCNSLRASGHRIRVFLLVAGGQSEGLGLSNTKSFDEGGRKGFQFCAEKPSDISSYNSDAFNDVESAMTGRLSEIAGELKQRGSFVRLIQ